MFKKLLSMLGIRQPVARNAAKNKPAEATSSTEKTADLSALLEVANEAVEPELGRRKLSRKKRKQVNLASQQHYIKSDRQRVAAALQRDKASGEKNLDKANKSFASGLYRRSRWG